MFFTAYFQDQIVSGKEHFYRYKLQGFMIVIHFHEVSK